LVVYALITVTQLQQVYVRTVQRLFSQPKLIQRLAEIVEVLGSNLVPEQMFANYELHFLYFRITVVLDAVAVNVEVAHHCGHNITRKHF